MSHPDPNQLTTSRRGLLNIMAMTAGAWGLSGPILSPAFAQANPSATGSGKALEQLRIGYQKSAANLVIVKQQGALEKRFPNTKVAWIEFPAGPQLLEALSIGALEFGMTGDSPPVFAQAAGKDLVYVGAEPPKPDSSAILVLRDSPLKTLADLKGKKIALQKGSSAHYLVVRAIEKAGLQWSDIQPIYLTPADARAAFERKSVDAWGIWDPFFAATELAIQPRILTTGRGLSGNNSFYLASKDFATQHSGAVVALFEELTKADQLVQEHRPEAIKLISAFSGLDAGVVSLFLQRRPRSPVTPLSAATTADQQRVADAFARLGLIPKPLRVADIVWKAV
ncbi:MAG: aliphatic sulfonate ABC transporter substrate-binding protein [Burkholderiales bacterium PBB3]|nr:MAG: aliphatic sulfonate ABC transporter substrate-binding protein [Burkholderiales bacterium PBB3]